MTANHRIWKSIQLIALKRGQRSRVTVQCGSGVYKPEMCIRIYDRRMIRLY